MNGSDLAFIDSDGAEKLIQDTIKFMILSDTFSDDLKEEEKNPFEPDMEEDCTFDGLFEPNDTFTWGTSLHGELGRVVGHEKTVRVVHREKNPGLVLSLQGNTIIKIAAGDRRTLAMDTKGNIFTWGRRFGKSIDENERHRPRMYLWSDLNTLPVQIPLHRSVSDIFCGFSHCAFLVDHRSTLWTMGSNRYGQLGVGLVTSKVEPVLVEFKGVLIDQFLLVSLGAHHSAVVLYNKKREKLVFTWGRGSYGAHGHTLSRNLVRPRCIDYFINKNVVDLQCGDSHTCFRLHSGKTHISGCISSRSVIWGPAPIPCLENLWCKQVFAGKYQTFLLLDSDCLKVWPGYIDNLEEDEILNAPPEDVCLPSGEPLIAQRISVKSNRMIFQSIQSQLYSSGLNEHGQIEWVQLSKGLNPLSIHKFTCGVSHFCALSEIKSIYSQDICSLFERMLFVDTILRISGKRFFCHRAILMCRLGEWFPFIESNFPCSLWSGDGKSSGDKSLDEEPEFCTSILEYDLGSLMPYDALRSILMWAYSANFQQSGLRNAGGRDLEFIQHFSSRFGVEIFSKGSQIRIMSLHLSKLLQKGCVAGDVKLLVKKTEIMAHRCILSARSQYFMNVLGSGMEESKLQIIDLNEEKICLDSFHSVMEWLYCANIPNLEKASWQSIAQVLVLADRFALPELKKACEVSMFNALLRDSNPSADVLFSVLKFSHMFRALRLRSLLLNSDKASPLIRAIEEKRFIFDSTQPSFDPERELFINDRWGVESLVFFVHCLYNRLRKERRAANEYYSHRRQSLLIQHRSREASIDDENFVVSQEDLQIMEQPYMVLFMMNTLTAVVFMLSCGLILLKLELPRSFPQWNIIFVAPMLAVVFSVAARLAHYQHRSKFRMNWWKSRQDFKQKSNLELNYKRLSGMVEVIRNIPNSSLDNLNLGNINLQEEKRHDQPFINDEIESIDSETDLEQERDYHVDSSLSVSQVVNNILKEQKNIHKELTTSYGFQDMASAKQDVIALVISLYARVSMLVFLAIFGQSLDKEESIHLKPSQWALVWSSLLLSHLMYFIFGVYQACEYFLQVWSRRVNRNTGIFAKLGIISMIFFNVAFSLMTSPTSVMIIQSIFLFVVLYTNTNETISWFVTLLPSLLSIGFVTCCFLLVDSVAFFFLIIAISSSFIRSRFFQLFIDFSNRNAYISWTLVCGSYFLAHVFFCSAFTALCMTAFKLQGGTSISFLHIGIPVLVFNASLLLTALWMFRLRRYAWDSYYHVWRQA